MPMRKKRPILNMAEVTNRNTEVPVTSQSPVEVQQANETRKTEPEKPVPETIEETKEEHELQS